MNMNITSARYNTDKINGGNASIQAIIDGVEWSVPLDPNNRHYQAIQEWVAEGNTIQDAD